MLLRRNESKGRKKNHTQSEKAISSIDIYWKCNWSKYARKMGWKRKKPMEETDSIELIFVRYHDQILCR